MELDETMLRQRFDTAVADVLPDTVALVGAGQQAGTALRRRRRWQAGGGVLAVLAIVGAGAVVNGAGIFEDRTAQPTDTSPTTSEQLVDATPRGLAAAVIDLVGLGTPTDVGGERHASDGASDTSLQVGAAYAVGGQKLSIEAIATSPVTQWQSASCGKTQDSRGQTTVWCDDSPLPDGTAALRLLMSQQGTSSTEQGGDVSYVAVVAVKRDHELVAVVETIPPGDASQVYDETNLPVSFDKLTALATDPRIGFSTTEGYNAAGQQLADFKPSLVTSSSGSGSSSASVEAQPPAPAQSQGTGSARPARTPPVPPSTR